MEAALIAVAAETSLTQQWAMTVVTGLIAAVAGAAIAAFTVHRTLGMNKKLEDHKASRHAAVTLRALLADMGSSAHHAIQNGRQAVGAAVDGWEKALDLEGQLIDDLQLFRRLERYGRDLRALDDAARAAHDGNPRTVGRMAMDPGAFDIDAWAEQAAKEFAGLQDWIERSLVGHTGRKRLPPERPATHWPAGPDEAQTGAPL